MKWMNRVGFVNEDYIKEKGCERFFNRLSQKVKGDKIVYINRGIGTRYYDLLVIKNSITKECFAIPTPMFLIAMCVENITIEQEIDDINSDIKGNYIYNDKQNAVIFKFLPNNNIWTKDEYNDFKNYCLKDKNMKFYNDNYESLFKNKLELSNEGFQSIVIYDADYDLETCYGYYSIYYISNFEVENVCYYDDNNNNEVYIQNNILSLKDFMEILNNTHIIKHEGFECLIMNN